MHENIASADLQNPSDALEILAHVADQTNDGDSEGSEQAQMNAHLKQMRPAPQRPDPGPTESIPDYFHYQPLINRSISPEMIYHLFSRYFKHINLFRCS